MFKVYMEEENQKNIQPGGEDDMNLVIQGFDGDLALGAVGFTVNNMNGAYLDRFHVESFDCSSMDDTKDNLLYTPPKCSRFKESFFTAFEDM